MQTDKIIIDPKNTAIGRAVDINRLYHDWLFRLIFLAVWIAGITSILIIATFYAKIETSYESFLGPSFIGLGLFLFYLSWRSFFYNKLIKPIKVTPKMIKVEIAAGKTVNLFSAFSFGLAEATEGLFRSKKVENISTKDLLAALFLAKDLDFILLRLGLSSKTLEEALQNYKGKSEVLKIISRAINIAEVNNQLTISSGDVLAALSEIDDFAKNLADNLKIDAKDLVNLVAWQIKIMNRIDESHDFLNLDHLHLTGGIGKDWAFGFTNFLRRFSSDMTQSIKESGLNLEIIGRDGEIKQIEEALLHQSNGNVIVVGDAGSGKRTTILGFAKKVLEGETPAFSHFHIFQVDTDALLSGVTDPGELVAMVRRILEEASYAGNVIILIENIENILSEGGVGKVNVAEVLIPWLDRGGVHIIGTTNVESYNKVILENPALTQRFTRVSIEEPTKDEIAMILMDTVPMIEYRSKTVISYEAIKETIKAADKYILNLPNPEKSINLLEGAALLASSQRGETIVLPKDIQSYVEEKYAIPNVEVGENEKSALLNLEMEIHKTVIGQDEAIKAIADAMRRSRTQVSDSAKPIGSFLFLGPTGVGKTALAKALARSYFGEEVNMIRFDMSEYQNKEDIYRLIGSSGGPNGAPFGGEPGQLVTQVREKPFSLLLFDEVEKANPDIRNLFLQILDEGILTDANGKKVSFKNTIIIATSNAGANVIREAISRNIPYIQVKERLVDYLIKNNLFRPELINRFTGVIAFSPLSLPEINQVAQLLINKLAADVKTNKNITLQVADDALAELARQGYDPEMGARPMERVIQEKIENLLADKILKNELKKGDNFIVTREMIA